MIADNIIISFINLNFVYTMELMVSFKGEMCVLNNWLFLFQFLLIKICLLKFSHTLIMFVVFFHISYT